MPKITKRTTKKVNSKNKSILSKRFDLKSRKVQFFVSILIIAVIGGGWFTYRSFAATTKWTYNIANRNLTHDDDVNKSCKSIRVKEPEKSNQIVISVTCTDRTRGVTEIGTVGARASANKTYRACAFVKGLGWPNISIGGDAFPPRAYRGDPYTGVSHNIFTGNYTYICSKSLKTVRSGEMHGHISVYNTNQPANTSNFRVANIIIEQL